METSGVDAASETSGERDTTTRKDYQWVTTGANCDGCTQTTARSIGTRKIEILDRARIFDKARRDSAMATARAETEKGDEVQALLK